MKKIITIIAIIAVVTMVATGAILGGIFGTISASANSSYNYSEKDAEQKAIEHLKATFGDDQYIVTDYDYDITHDHSIGESYYVHEFEFSKGARGEIDVYVNAETGDVSLRDFDRD